MAQPGAEGREVGVLCRLRSGFRVRRLLFLGVGRWRWIADDGFADDGRRREKAVIGIGREPLAAAIQWPGRRDVEAAAQRWPGCSLLSEGRA